MLTLDDAINHCHEKAKEQKKQASIFGNNPVYYKKAQDDCLECAKEHEQLAEWLTELKARREQDDKNYSAGYRDATLDARHFYEEHNRKQRGKWIEHEEGYNTCPLCRYNTAFSYKFCPNCGTQMQETDNIFKDCPICGNSFAYTDVCPVCGAELKEADNEIN